MMMMSSDDKTSDPKWPMLVPDLSTLCSLEDITMVKPGKIMIKGYAVSGVGRGIKRLEISLDRCESWIEVSRIKRHYMADHNEPSRVSFEATIDALETIDVIAKAMKIRAIVVNKPLSEKQQGMLVLDVIRLVLERLNFAAFHNARSVSSDWYSAAESCSKNSPTPWLILFPSNHFDGIDDVSCKLFDPRDNKTYLVRDLGFDFHRSCCLANSGSWLLMLSHRTDFYLLNVFTRERICLPTLEEIDGWQMWFKRVGESDFLVTFAYEGIGVVTSGKSNKVRVSNAVLWVDERSKDYLVVWNLDCFFAYHKKSDSNKTWKLFQHQGCIDMVLKGSKLHVLSSSRKIIVFDFSCGDSPKECASFPSPKHDKHHFNNIAVTLSGEILMIAGRVKPPEICYFDVYKLDPESLKWRKVNSLGNEALLLDLGTTVAAKDGVWENFIYFGNDKLHRYNEISLFYETSICVYNIKSKKVVQRFRHLLASSRKPFKDARWFFPTFGGKWLL